ncbi:MAG: ribosome small subunit-dependent GTPase A [Thermoleophilia bacterium]
MNRELDLGTLVSYGWDDYFSALLREYSGEGEAVGRVVAEYAGAYVVRAAEGEYGVRVSGRLRHESRGDPANLPAVGDWVVFARPGGDGRGLGMIHGVLPRRTKLSRRAAGAEATEQVIAANVDVVFVVSALGQDLNLRRIERYLATVWEGGATPVLVLTKTDLADDLQAARAAVEPVAGLVDVRAVSALTGEGLSDLDAYLNPGRTLALIGSSGVGKSTLVNYWLGKNVQEVLDVREDGKGRHATTHRQLFVLPSGALVIDTPGMREVGLWGAERGVEEAFPEIQELAHHCRFRDCRHEGEPGCAVREAVEQGRLSQDRLEAFRKLRRELEDSAARREVQSRREKRRKERRMAKEIRRTPKKRR